MLGKSTSTARGVAGACVAASLLITALPASGAERVVVFSFEGFELPKDIEMAPFGLANLVSRRLEESGHEIVEPPLTLRDMVVAVGCEEMTDACGRKIAEHNDATRVVAGRLSGGSGGTVAINIRVHFDDGRPSEEVTDTRPADLKSLTSAFADLADRVRVLVESKPADMADLSAMVEKSGKSGNALLPVGIAALGLGVAAGAVGAVFAAQWFAASKSYREGLAPYVTGDGPPALPVTDGFEGRRDLCEDRDMRLDPKVAAELEAAGVFRACDRLRSSNVIAWIAGGAGVALLATGVALVALGASKPHDAAGAGRGSAWVLTPTVAPGFGGGTLTVSF